MENNEQKQPTFANTKANLDTVGSLTVEVEVKDDEGKLHPALIIKQTNTHVCVQMKEFDQEPFWVATNSPNLIVTKKGDHLRFVDVQDQKMLLSEMVQAVDSDGSSPQTIARALEQVKSIHLDEFIAWDSDRRPVSPPPQAQSAPLVKAVESKARDEELPFDASSDEEQEASSESSGEETEQEGHTHSCDDMTLCEIVDQTNTHFLWDCENVDSYDITVNEPTYDHNDCSIMDLIQNINAAYGWESETPTLDALSDIEKSLTTPEMFNFNLHKVDTDEFLVHVVPTNKSTPKKRRSVRLKLQQQEGSGSGRKWSYIEEIEE